MGQHADRSATPVAKPRTTLIVIYIMYIYLYLLLLQQHLWECLVSLLAELFTVELGGSVLQLM